MDIVHHRFPIQRQNSFSICLCSLRFDTPPKSIPFQPQETHIDTDTARISPPQFVIILIFRGCSQIVNIRIYCSSNNIVLNKYLISFQSLQLIYLRCTATFVNFPTMLQHAFISFQIQIYSCTLITWSWFTDLFTDYFVIFDQQYVHCQSQNLLTVFEAKESQLQEVIFTTISLIFLLIWSKRNLTHLIYTALLSRSIAQKKFSSVKPVTYTFCYYFGDILCLCRWVEANKWNERQPRDTCLILSSRGHWVIMVFRPFIHLKHFFNGFVPPWVHSECENDDTLISKIFTLV